MRLSDWTYRDSGTLVFVERLLDLPRTVLYVDYNVRDALVQFGRPANRILRLMVLQ
jgi:hypothetical protein